MEKFTREETEERWGTPEQNFIKYSEDFHLSKEDLQKPLLDLGAGNAAFIEYLRNILGNREAYGIERQSIKIPPHQEGLVVGDGLNLPFQDEVFEIVLAKNYLPMFVGEEEKMEQAISEPLRVLKHGGKMLGNIATPENVQRVLHREGNRKNEWLTRRYEGAQKLQLFLTGLKAKGYSVEFMGPQSGDVVSIQKL